MTDIEIERELNCLHRPCLIWCLCRSLRGDLAERTNPRRTPVNVRQVFDWQLCDF